MYGLIKRSAKHFLRWEVFQMCDQRMSGQSIILMNVITRLTKHL